MPKPPRPVGSPGTPTRARVEQTRLATTTAGRNIRSSVVPKRVVPKFAVVEKRLMPAAVPDAKNEIKRKLKALKPAVVGDKLKPMITAPYPKKGK